MTKFNFGNTNSDNPYQLPEPESKDSGVSSSFLILVLIILIIVNFLYVSYIWENHRWNALGTSLLLSLVQFILGFLFGCFAKKSSGLRVTGWLSFWLSFIPFLNALLIAIGSGVAGGAWGRPLRIRGRQLHPELREGSDWTRGLQPDPTGLDEPTRHALETLWLHDAQKEHASVPAFSRIAWMLAAVGAPAELMEWAHRAALEEIEHTRLCFALAAGYVGRSHTVEPMPDLLLGGLDEKANPLVTLAVESLSDGCQLEDFNADVAAACAEICQEPATRGVLEIITREERTHADFSWALLHGYWNVTATPFNLRLKNHLPNSTTTVVLRR